MKTDNTKLSEVGYRYLNYFKIKITKQKLITLIEQNPNFPSLLSFSETLDRISVKNSAYHIDNNQFDNLTPPFICYKYIKGKGKDFVYIEKINEDFVWFRYDSFFLQVVNKKDFLNDFRNIVLFAHPDNLSGDPDYSTDLKKEKQKNIGFWGHIVLFTILFATLVYLSVPVEYKFFFAFLLTGKLIGIALTILLIGHDFQGSVTKKFCSVGKKINCDAVLNSSVSKVLGISLSEIGFLYFVSSAAILFVPNIPFDEKIRTLSFLNVLVVPFTLFSFFYQWKVIKQWCILCVFVQAILIFEFIVNFTSYWNNIYHEKIFLLREYLPILLSVFACYLVWYYLKNIISKSNQLSSQINAYKRLLYNPSIFKLLLEKEEKAYEFDDKIGIILGNKNAKNVIIKVCNPYCSPCSNMHPRLHELIKNKNIKLQIIFISRNEDWDISAIVTKHFLAIYEEGDVEKIEIALNYWYSMGNKDYESFAKKFPVTSDLNKYKDQISGMRNWVEKSDILHTPTIFINGFRLPENYEIEELKSIF